ENGSRQRVNVFRQSGKLAASIRLLNENIPTFAEIGLPPYVTEMLSALKGLILVTGVTGSGKSTTLASMVDYINQNRQCHILTIEDPIEYRYTPKAATIRQREVGNDVKSFNYALRSALRENPDVILVGEMRDYETIKLALTAAETGHLVLATLHTTGAIHTINRIIDVFPKEEQNQVRMQLSFSLNGVISQCLMPMPEDRGRVAAFEILRNTEAAANLIRSEKVFQLRTIMQAGTKAGMVTLNESLKRLHLEGKISRETALEYSDDKNELSTFI
ncbi:MAG: PilT/PilU family type 4a pilus ATPase, partial [Ruminiclostridium sp.]|nr:PilT/PilU family type 4a pilus ATPase [Ruminiclostridium sp.]